jgi:hypothetical protein
LALDGGEWSASHSSHFTSGERTHGTHCIVGWVGPRAGLDAVVKRRNLIISSEDESNIFQMVLHIFKTPICIVRLRFYQAKTCDTCYERVGDTKTGSQPAIRCPRSFSLLTTKSPSHTYKVQHKRLCTY